MNGVDFPVARVLDGIAAARAAGLAPIKVNMVVRRGMNEASIVPLARWARDEGLVLRFIEYMDVGDSNGWRLDDVVPAEEILALVDAVHPARARPAGLPGRGRRPLSLPRRVRGDRRHRVGDAGRSAATARGRACRPRAELYTCLFAVAGTDLRTPLRDGAADAELAALDRANLGARATDRYSELRTSATTDLPKVEMFAIGG